MAFAAFMLTPLWTSAFTFISSPMQHNSRNLSSKFVLASIAVELLRRVGTNFLIGSLISARLGTQLSNHTVRYLAFYRLSAEWHVLVRGRINNMAARRQKAGTVSSSLEATSDSTSHVDVDL